MINHLPLVNQKLAYARVTLSLLLASPETGSERLRNQALVDATVFHLMSAYRFYLRELAENYRVDNVNEIMQISDLHAAFDSVGKNSSEMAELVSLESASESWLAQIIAYSLRLTQSLEKVKESKAFPVNGELIPMIDVTADLPTANVDARSLEQALFNFQALVERQRESSAEY